jgi:bifunctional DNA-binding transcriptional regulator/antitoxin component of YhaV-PrlF toxin-antitoxin module
VAQSRLPALDFDPLIVRTFYLTLGGEMRPPMSNLTVTAKGQVTLRKDLLKHLGVNPGEKITVDKLPDGRIEVKAARPAGKISDAFGFLKKKDGPFLSVEEMNEIAARGWAGKR